MCAHCTVKTSFFCLFARFSKKFWSVYDVFLAASLKHDHEKSRSCFCRIITICYFTVGLGIVRGSGWGVVSKSGGSKGGNGAAMARGSASGCIFYFLVGKKLIRPANLLPDGKVGDSDDSSLDVYKYSENCWDGGQTNWQGKETTLNSGYFNVSEILSAFPEIAKTWWLNEKNLFVFDLDATFVFDLDATHREKGLLKWYKISLVLVNNLFLFGELKIYFIIPNPLFSFLW